MVIVTGTSIVVARVRAGAYGVLMDDASETVWTVGDVARDPRDGEVVEVMGPVLRGVQWGSAPREINLYPVVVLEVGRGGPSGPSALAGERTMRALNDPDFPYERAADVELLVGSEPA